MNPSDQYEAWDKMKEHFNLKTGKPDKSEIYPGDIIVEENSENVPLGVVLRVEEDSAIISLDGGASTIQVDKEDFTQGTLICDSCESKKVHHDSTEEWLCPFCEL